MRVHEYVFRSINGSSMPLDRWTGQPLLLVNTASECDHTPQYQKLQLLWEEYRPNNLVIIGIPSNDFGGQEPGDDETIQEFCSSRYGVTFPLTSKQSIIDIGAHPLFTAMREEYTREILPRGNFYKYLFGSDGSLLHHWPSEVEPDAPRMKHEIERSVFSWSL